MAVLRSPVARTLRDNVYTWMCECVFVISTVAFGILPIEYTCMCVFRCFSATCLSLAWNKLQWLNLCVKGLQKSTQGQNKIWLKVLPSFSTFVTLSAPGARLYLYYTAFSSAFVKTALVWVYFCDGKWCWFI